MKEKNILYADIGEAIGVSLPTVKRLMTDNDISLSRLVSICEKLEISFFDLIDRVRSENADSFRFTKEQEEFFGDHPDCLAFLFELAGGRSVTAIRQRHGISNRSVNRYLKQLEAVSLIERRPDDEVKVLIRPNNFVWDDDGPIGKKYSRHFISEFAEHTLAKLDQPEDLKLFIGTRNFSRKNYTDFSSELDDLLTKYRSISSMNRNSDDSGNQKMSFLMVADFWSESFFGRIRDL